MVGSGCSAGRKTARPEDAPTSHSDEAQGSRGESTAVSERSDQAPKGAKNLPIPCPEAYPPSFRFVTGTELRPMPLIPEPPARRPFLDPVFKTCIVRVTDRTRDLMAGDRSVGLKNEYSRVNGFNADSSLVLVRGTESTWYLYDVRTQKRLRRLPIDGAVDPRWDARNPDILYYTPDTRLVRLNVVTGASTTVRDFKRDFASWKPEMVFSRWEGSPSADGMTFAFMVRDANKVRGIFVYDLRDVPRDTDGKPGEILGRYDLATHRPIRDADPDSVSMSLSGKYVWAQFDYCERESPVGTFTRPCGAMVFDRKLSSGRGVVRMIGHADLALDASGRDVAIYQDNDTDEVSLLDLESGKKTPLHPIDFSQGSLGFHFSGRAYQRPGWAVVSVYDKVPKTKFWLSHLVYAIELKPHGRIVPLAHHHSLRDDERGEADYFAEPHASTNHDLTRVVFGSNWHRVGTNSVEMYMIALPPDWTGRLARGL